MPTSCCFQDMEGSSSPCYVQPPGHKPLSHLLPIQSWPEPDRAAQSASPKLFTRQPPLYVRAEAPTPKILLWMWSGLSLLHPPAPQGRGKNKRPPAETEKTDPLCSLCPISASIEVHDPPLLLAVTSKAFLSLLSALTSQQRLPKMPKISKCSYIAPNLKADWKKSHRS